MLETRFKVVFLLAVLFAASLPIIAILRGTISTPLEAESQHSEDESVSTAPDSSASEQPLEEELVVIPAGPFIRGTSQGGFDEQPERKIYLDEFSIDRYEVTNGQYKRCVDVGKCTMPENDSWSKQESTNYPVTNVDWLQAKIYAEWMEGRLPSEAQWEKTCRGTDSRIYPWGNTWDPLNARTSTGRSPAGR